MAFDKWMAALCDVAKEHGFEDQVLDEILYNAEHWFVFWDQGMTPREAFCEDVSSV